MNRSESGAVTPLLVAVAGLILLLSVAVVDVGSVLTAHGTARAAADAAALAAAPVTFRPFGAAGSAAREAALFAAANGTRLVSCRCASDPSWEARVVEVVVERQVDLMLLGERRVTARSRARFDPGAMATPPGSIDPPSGPIRPPG